MRYEECETCAQSDRRYCVGCQPMLRTDGSFSRTGWTPKPGIILTATAQQAQYVPPWAEGPRPETGTESSETNTKSETKPETRSTRMGRRGHVMTRAPEYGSCITAAEGVQKAFLRYLNLKGLWVLTPDDFCDAEEADHWDIEIPCRADRLGRSRKDYASVRRLVEDLRAHPEQVEGDDGSPHGLAAADILEEGLEAARRQNLGTITIDWF